MSGLLGGLACHTAPVPFTLEVLPPLLSSTGLRQQMAGDRLGAIAAALEAAGGDAAGAAGEPGLAAALGELGASGGGAVRSMGVAVGGLGTNLGSAADAYLNTDHSAMPGG